MVFELDSDQRQHAWMIEIKNESERFIKCVLVLRDKGAAHGLVDIFGIEKVSTFICHPSRENRRFVNFAKNRRNQISSFCFDHISKIRGRRRGWLTYLESWGQPLPFDTLPPVKIGSLFILAEFLYRE